MRKQIFAKHTALLLALVMIFASTSTPVSVFAREYNEIIVISELTEVPEIQNHIGPAVIKAKNLAAAAVRLIGEAASRTPGTDTWTTGGRSVEFFQQGGEWFGRTTTAVFRIIFN